MLDRFSIIDKAIKHFPKWMDIRKRTSSSNGGNYLQVVAEEIEDINAAIDVFKSDFFIDRIDINKYPAFLFKGIIGEINTDDLRIISYDAILASTKESFYNSNANTLIIDGYIYIKSDAVELYNNIESCEINYIYDNNPGTIKVNKIHVWNVFDEFAMFRGIERHQWEDNKQLKDRILSFNRNNVNGTEEGLKNSIINELSNYISINKDDIKIHRVCAESLKIYKDMYEDLFDNLNNINRDTYRNKKWDLDKWEYNLNNIEYVPHIFDFILNETQNGVGYNNDLKVDIVTQDKPANANLYVYDKDIKALDKYIQNNNIQNDIKLNLTKFNNKITPIPVSYTITGSQVIDITNEDITISLKQINSSKENVPIERLIETSSLDDFDIIHHGAVNNGKYKILFEPKEELKPMIINKCDVGNSTQIISLLKDDLYFKRVGNELHSKNTLLFANKVKHFFSHENMIEENEALISKDISKESQLKLDLHGMRNQPVYINWDAAYSLIPKMAISLFNMQYNNDDIESFKDYNGNSMTIVLEANDISFDIKEGNTTISYYEEDILISTSIYRAGDTFTSNKFNKPKNMKIVATNNNFNSSLVFSKLQYKKFELNYCTEFGELKSIAGKNIIPDFEENKLIMEFKSYTNTSIILKSIYIGQPNKNINYLTAPVDTVDMFFDIMSENCKVKLITLDDNQNIISVNEDFKTYKEYVANKMKKIELNLLSYSNVNGIESQTGNIKTEKINNVIKYYLELQPGESVSYISISGTRHISVDDIRLADLLGINKANGDKVFVNNLIKDFIVFKNNKFEKVKLLKENFPIGNADSFIVNTPKNLISIFYETDSSFTISNSYDNSFKYIGLRINNSMEYVAINEEKIFKPITKNIKIVDIFKPLIPNNENILYVIKSNNNNADVRFDTDESFLMCEDWSIGKKDITIKYDLSLDNSDIYEKNMTSIVKSVKLKDSVPIENIYKFPNGELIESTKIIIDTDDLSYVLSESRDYSLTEFDQPQFYKLDAFKCNSSEFVKLKHCRIEEILYIGFDPELNNEIIDSSKYSLCNKEGILVFNDFNIYSSTRTIYIKYTIKIPKYIRYDLSNKEVLNMFYKKIQYDFTAYKLSDIIKIYNIDNNTEVNLFNYSSYSNDSKIKIEFIEPTGYSPVFIDHKLTFEKLTEKKLLAVKKGYYYMNNKEYYMFNDYNIDHINSNKDVVIENGKKEEDKITINKESQNHIINSKMERTELDVTHNSNFKKDAKGISLMNSLTSCNTFNQWNSYGFEISLTEGFNGLGLSFKKTLPIGYCILNITDKLSEGNNFISLYCSNKIKIGNKINDSLTAIIDSFIDGEGNKDLKYCYLNKNKDSQYYLIIDEDAVIDDIIISTEYPKDNALLHKKNINELGISINELRDNMKNKKVFLNNEGSKLKGCYEYDNFIVNGTSILWDKTTICNYIAEDFKSLNTQYITVKDGIAYTNNDIAKIESNPIAISDCRTIKSLHIEMNEIFYDKYTNIYYEILTCNQFNGNYIKLKDSRKNRDIIDTSNSSLLTYIKFIIHLPKDKAITNFNIYAEHMSKDMTKPISNKLSGGIFESKILDTFNSSNYIPKKINFKEGSNLQEIDFFICGSKLDYKNTIWSDFYKINIDTNGNITNETFFKEYRFFKIKAILKNKESKLNIESIDFEVK